jgi:uncharacterized protein YbaP (TraB family)
MVNLLVAAALATATPASAAPATVVNEDPAIFVVRDADTTVYIFGTFHALDGKGEWFNDQVRDAFEKSDELVLETLIPEGPPAPGTELGAAPARQLRALPVASSASFLATTRLAITAGRSRGMQVGNGADMVLRRVAEQEGKPVEGLETLQEQLSMFDRMPQPIVAPPRSRASGSSTGQIDGLSKSMAVMQSAWKRGDQRVFVSMLDQLSRASPDTYRVMFTERNARWADWISARLGRPGTVFVAVGAGHLAGKDSLLARLGDRGIYSTRVN